VNAPLLQQANINKTPNPSKAPWYFLGLQELLTMFHPMIAGVTPSARAAADRLPRVAAETKASICFRRSI